MKYYKLSYNSLNIKETGTQFQSIDGIMGDIQQNFIPFEGEINFPFKLPTPFLQTKAKPTTFLHVMMIPDWFMVFKDYFIDFLKKFNIGEYQTWKLDVHHNNEIINDYSMFYTPNTFQKEIIDFKKSKFEISENWITRNSIVETIEFSDYKEYFTELKKHTIPPYLLAYELFLDFSKQESDLIRLINMPMTGTGYYVSEKLRIAIEKERFTGFSFQEIEEMDNRIKVTY